MVNRVGDTYFPGSSKPFDPLNKWGAKAKPLRHDGSVMPDGWQNPLGEELYQIHVDDRERGNIPVGPKAGLNIVNEWLSLLKIAIKGGQVTGWSDPYLVKQPRQRAVARLF